MTRRRKTVSATSDQAGLLARAQSLQARNMSADALALCRALWASQPDDPDLLLDLGALLLTLGEHAAALPCYQRAAVRQPGLAGAHAGIGAALYALGRPADAIPHYDRALGLQPNDPDTLTNQGTALYALGRNEDALRSYDAALRLRPVLAIAWYNRGNLLRETGRLTESLASLDRALAIQPDFALARNNRGVTLQLLNRHAEALEAHDRAAAALPRDPDILNGLGTALFLLNRHQEALEAFDRALAEKPDLALAHVNRAYCNLALGRYADAWQDHEARWELSAFQSVRHDLAHPLWQGGPDLDGKTILLWAEQGFGDVLQFCRYVPMVARRAQVVLLVPPPLLRLMTSLPGGGQLVVPGQTPPPFDLQSPLMSLPLAFGTDLATIPHDVPYLSATPADIAVWRQRLAPLTGLRVGIVWAGNPRSFDLTHQAVDRRRSCGLAQFAPLARVGGIDFVSLQKEVDPPASRTPPPGMVLHDWTDQIHDFADTAALIETLDLVISVDTSVVHLAGALGKPVWVLSRFDACWRWLIDREDSPWYPTARVFRQSRPGDWAGVMARVAAELRTLTERAPRSLRGREPVPGPRPGGRTARRSG